MERYFVDASREVRTFPPYTKRARILWALLFLYESILFLTADIITSCIHLCFRYVAAETLTDVKLIKIEPCQSEVEILRETANQRKLRLLLVDHVDDADDREYEDGKIDELKDAPELPEETAEHHGCDLDYDENEALLDVEFHERVILRRHVGDNDEQTQVCKHTHECLISTRSYRL